MQVEDDLPGVISLPEQGRAQEPLNVRCGRCMRFCGFCCVCTGTLFQALVRQPVMNSSSCLGGARLTGCAACRPPRHGHPTHTHPLQPRHVVNGWCEMVGVGRSGPPVRSIEGFSPAHHSIWSTCVSPVVPCTPPESVCKCVHEKPRQAGYAARTGAQTVAPPCCSLH